MLQREQIAPGVHLNTIEADKFNRCRISLHFRFPASKEKATEHALLPLVLERGYADCPDMTQFSRQLARLYGASLSVETHMQGATRVISIAVSGIKDRFALQGENLSAAYAQIAFGVAFRPYLEEGLFSQEAVQIEKDTLARQLESEKNDKRLYCVRQARRHFFGNHPAGVERDGYLSQVSAITPASLTQTYQDMLEQAELDVICMGASQQEVRELLQQSLASIHRKPAQLLRQSFIDAKPLEHLEEQMDLAQAKLCMMFTADRCVNPEEMAVFRMAMSVFGGSSTSRLFLNVREKQSLCYYCSCRFVSSTAMMMVDSGVEPKDAERAEQAILEQLHQLMSGEITAQEMEDNRRSVLSGLMAVEDSLAGLENWYYTEILRGGAICTPQQAAQAVQNVTAEQIQGALAGFHYQLGYLITQPREDMTHD
ncbi:MAG: insulinase family protein [Candidatus Fournierella pullistercoris]|uniref:Insulinase family protein n=1 Tax=Candidatus Allofournierella pullistercoris TaxID=2838597 RepID=A0A948T2C0_9FIRM|nr:insulinase family protein [Candidatus Fournierella pullistercoris]